MDSEAVQQSNAGVRPSGHRSNRRGPTARRGDASAGAAPRAALPVRHCSCVRVERPSGPRAPGARRPGHRVAGTMYVLKYCTIYSPLLSTPLHSINNYSLVHVYCISTPLVSFYYAYFIFLWAAGPGGIAPPAPSGDNTLWRFPPQTHRASYTIPSDEQLVAVAAQLRNVADMYRLGNRLGTAAPSLTVYSTCSAPLFHQLEEPKCNELPSADLSALPCVAERYRSSEFLDSEGFA